MMRHRLSPDAAADIEGMLSEGIDRFGVMQALDYHAKLESLFDLLCRNPKMGRELTTIRPPVRMQPFVSHIVVYEIERVCILILRVRHHREGWAEDPLGDS